MRAMPLACVLFSIVCGSLFAAERYNYRSSDAYRDLRSAEREQLDQVHRDFVLLWGALDMYARDHEGQVPKELSDLVPAYLKELPRDPFATQATAAREDTGGFKSSVDGFGYRYRPGHGDAYVISSAGLKRFPYRADRGDSGLYTVKGEWFGGLQFFR